MYIVMSNALPARKAWFVFRAFAWHTVKRVFGKKPKYTITITLNHDLKFGCIIARFDHQSEARKFARSWHNQLGMLIVVKLDADSCAE